ncbi:1882_t:CDS:2 [Dentiscutata heterogama]|uniref:1882_t:CDS:1 n=1 Tax=Dentiscutata heterogama TaxID=1316150 RepID=A0ACA9KA74_9GLOM|nr:1882_t:CDS:2 [Dentiscutata heterogama]
MYFRRSTSIKLLPFVTIQEKKETEAQIRAELLVLETQVTNSNSEEIERNLVTTNKDLQDSLSAELWGSCSISDQDLLEC